VAPHGGTQDLGKFRAYTKDPRNNQLTISLTDQSVTAPSGTVHTFEISPADREMLMEGLDSIAVTMKRDDEILAFQARDRLKRPWVYL
jgi:3-isopropylmalate/(R)-2-methylmalate dehydratase small subunit